jgi:hypothetical protein
MVLSEVKRPMPDRRCLWGVELLPFSLGAVPGFAHEGLWFQVLPAPEACEAARRGDEELPPDNPGKRRGP